MKLRLTAFASDREQVESEVEVQINKLKKLAEKFIYGYNKDRELNIKTTAIAILNIMKLRLLEN